jgi:cobalt-zinc-cadmium efflux system protein
LRNGAIERTSLGWDCFLVNSAEAHTHSELPKRQERGQLLGHDHHDHGPANYDRAFAIGVGLNVMIVVVQVVLGLFADSLALLADAGHNLSDVLGLLLAWGASVLCRRAPTENRTYGWRRSSILAALANALLLMFVTGGVTWEALRRLTDPHPTEGGIVIVAATIAALVNAGAALLFLKGRHNDMNLRGAFLHLAADAAVSLGVALTGVAIMATGSLWLDPAVSLGIGVVILLSTWSLLRGATNLVLDAVPDNVDIESVRSYLRELPQVTGVHDLHVWPISTTETALTVHLILNGTGLNDALLCEIDDELHDRFGIEHATIQLEEHDQQHDCSLQVVHLHPAHNH